MWKAPMLIILLAASCFSSAQVTLRLKLPTGKTYRYVTETKMSQGAGGDMTQRMTQTVTVNSKTADRYNVTISTVDAKVMLPKNSPMAGQTAQMEKMMKGAKFSGAYGVRGNTLAAKASSQNAQVQQMMSAMGGMDIGFMGMEFPQAPVRVGSTWTATIDLAKMMGGMVAQGMKTTGGPMIVKYTVKALDAKTATIGYTISGKLNMSMTNPQTKQAMNMGMAMNGSGTSLVDIATGLQRSNTSATTTTITGAVAITQKMTTKMTLK